MVQWFFVRKERNKTFIREMFSPQSCTRELREHIWMMHCFMLTSVGPRHVEWLHTCNATKRNNEREQRKNKWNYRPYYLNPVNGQWAVNIPTFMQTSSNSEGDGPGWQLTENPMLGLNGQLWDACERLQQFICSPSEAAANIHLHDNTEDDLPTALQVDANITRPKQTIKCAQDDGTRHSCCSCHIISPLWEGIFWCEAHRYG